MSKESISKIYLIVEKIEYIEEIVSKSGTITTALKITLDPIQTLRWNQYTKLLIFTLTSR